MIWDWFLGLSKVLDVTNIHLYTQHGAKCSTTQKYLKVKMWVEFVNVGEAFKLDTLNRWSM